MDAKPKRLSGSELGVFLSSLGLGKEEPVGRSSDGGALATKSHLLTLLKKGDPLTPGPGRVAEDRATLNRLFAEASELACFGLTPDGHLTGHQPMPFDAIRAAEQVIALVEAEMAADDREEALAATWLVLAYHDHDHPADFGGLVRDSGGDGKPKCCYLDLKGTQARSPRGQRTKLEQRAQERKFGCLAQTVTKAADNGFAGYPGHGKPGLLVTLLHNPITESKDHAGYAMGWFFGISSNYQATAAVWGWGGKQGARLPEPLLRRLEAAKTTIRGQERSLLELLRDYRHYGQFKDVQGAWDREGLRSTLQAMFLAGRYLLMHEDPVKHAETTVAELQPKGVEEPLSPEDFLPGEAFAVYFGRKADENRRTAEENGRKADENARKADENARKADENARKADENARKADEAIQRERKLEESIRQMIARRREKGHSNAEIAEDLSCTVEELLVRYPQ